VSGQGYGKGSADFQRVGDWNAACSICGRKAKASTLVRNWMGLYRHPKCNEPRQPQDLIRGVADKPGAPWVQEIEVEFAPYTSNFPLLISPTALVLQDESIQLSTVGGLLLGTTQGDILASDVDYIGSATGIVPLWVYIESILWTWQSGGVGIDITTPDSLTTFFETSNVSASGVALLTVTGNLPYQVGTATLNVST